MNHIPDSPDQALIVARRRIDDRVQAARRRAQSYELRARRTSFPSAVLDFLHGGR